MERTIMERRLYKAAAEGDVPSLLDLLNSDPLILDRCLVSSYNETPLHVAAMLGHEHFVYEILDRKPELALELDSQKLSPLHLATAKGCVGLVKKLLIVNADMCHACDKYGRNPLHIAAIKDRVHVLKELVQVSPDAARQKIHGETILHLCVKHNNLEALKLLVEFVEDHEFVNLKNDDGDTILHLAAADEQTETISFLTSCASIEVNSLNADGLTAHDLLAPSGNSGRHRDSISTGGVTANVHEIESMTSSAANDHQRRGRKWSLNKQYDWLEQKKSALMVVASLIATMAFQVGTNPPGRFWQDTNEDTTNPHTAGFSIMADNYPGRYSLLLALNSSGFVASLSIVLLLVSGLPLRRRLYMWILMVILWIAITTIALTYGLSLTVFTPPHAKTSIYETVIVGIIFWAGFMLLLLVAHTIRLMLKTIRRLRELVRWRRPSA